MKLSLVVADGVHKGRSIPIGIPQFLIGRDPSCQLRPASEMISKRHAAVVQREERVFVSDLGSTNGTFVNDTKIIAETEVLDGDSFKVGPLLFTVKVEGAKPKVAPVPAKPTSDVDTREEDALTTPVPNSDDPHSDKIAAMLLLASDDDGPAPEQIPEGTTVMDIPALPDPNAKKNNERPKPSGDTRSAAEAILKKYRQRPRAGG